MQVNSLHLNKLNTILYEYGYYIWIRRELYRTVRLPEVEEATLNNVGSEPGTKVIPALNISFLPV